MIMDHSKNSWGLDMEDLLSRVEGDYDLLRDIVGIFQEEFPKSLRTLSAALDAGDCERAQRSAHTMKGMFSTLSFVQASACAQRIEHMARAHQFNGVAEELAYLKESALAAQTGLDRVCRVVN